MTKQVKNKLNWFVWFPYPSSWIKALSLIIFLNVIIFIVRIILISGFRISVIINSPHLLVLFGVFSLLIPIPIIAFTHHLLHLFLSKYISAIQTPEMKNTRGMKIKIFSWWEGLYSWLVIVISIMIATAMSIFLLPLFDFDLSIKVAQYNSYQKQIITIFGIIILVTAALLYQFEYCFKRGLLFVNLKIDKSN
ncbi:MAG: hypothetical protein AAF757_02615 [Cyanobacteria bacterium P01_D01_bin.116]